MNQNPIQEIKSAQKRCMSMGRHHTWQLDFDEHPLAACISNHLFCIDVELNEQNSDPLAIMFWILNIARKINQYCESYKVTGNRASEYWLEIFLWRCECIVVWQKL